MSDAADGEISPVEVIGGEGSDRRRPVCSPSDIEVGRLVEIAHETGLDAARAHAGAGLSDARFEAILSYCAEQRCVGDKATCRNCRLWSRAEEIHTLDAYVAWHGEIRVRDSGLVLKGRGTETREVESLGWIARHWAGEEIWFLARRVLRKLRYGVRRVDDLLDAQIDAAHAPAVILVEPQIPENIGMVARAMGNFGLHDLRVTAPRDGWPSEKARAVASGAAAIIDDARIEPSLETAISDLNWVAATTARQRDMRKIVMTPAQASTEMQRRIAEGQRCGIVFGRERHGLQSDEVALADAVVMIPVNNRFASLNLAQSVLLLGYEWLNAAGGGSLGRVTPNERPVEIGLHLGHDRLADKEALIGFFEHIEAELERLGFFHPAHRRDVVVRNLRTLFSRAQPTEQEVRTLRGIVATLAHGKGNSRK